MDKCRQSIEGNRNTYNANGSLKKVAIYQLQQSQKVEDFS